MKTGRSKLMLKLVEETSKNVRNTNFIHEKCINEEDSIPETPGNLARVEINVMISLTLEERQDAFEKFWKFGNSDREKQWLHVANYTTK
ncbi:unnamed protein product [Euphydryas editha]|uniref:Uncharacterized protein n=1 Tax=Euphydryas editha TaxID=104508 RepID=A0AAU9TSN7_EUPED|nr:unnamed protein product [Euphydryas editha]